MEKVPTPPEVLKRAKVDPKDPPQSDGRTKLLTACMRGDLDVVEVLLKKGVDANQETIMGFSPLYVACGVGQPGEDDPKISSRPKVLKALLAAGADPCWTHASTLRSALFNCRTKEQVHVLVEAGVDVNARDMVRQTALHCAVRFNYLEAVKALVELGADVSAESNPGMTPMLFAGRLGHEAIVDFLITTGLPWDHMSTKNHDTLLHVATVSTNISLVRKILSHDVNVNAEGHYQNTPLHIACAMGQLEIAQLFVNEGADISAMNAQSRDPILIALEAGNDPSCLSEECAAKVQQYIKEWQRYRDAESDDDYEDEESN